MRTSRRRVAQSCLHSDVDDMAEGRRSFPSGHTSTVFAGMVFLALFIAGLTSSWIFTQPLPSRRLPSSRLARLALTLSPLYYAMWVAVSRMEDYVRDKFSTCSARANGIFSATPQGRRDHGHARRDVHSHDLLLRVLVQPLHTSIPLGV